jgi:hypothetical protein
MKKIFLTILGVFMLATVAAAGSRTTISGYEIQDIGECKKYSNGMNLCVLVEGAHPKTGHLVQFLDKNNDGIPDFAFMYANLVHPKTKQHVGYKGHGRFKGSAIKVRDIVLEVCLNNEIKEKNCLKYANSFKGWK